MMASLHSIVRLGQAGALSILLALAACGDRTDDSQTVVNAGGGNRAAEESDATAVGNASVPAPDFARYVGKYPFDDVGGGVNWNNDPAIVDAIKAAVPDAAVRRWVLEGQGPSSPIEEKDGKILSWACEAHNCGPHNWTTIIDPTNGKAQICYVDEEAGKPRWFADGKEQSRADACPEVSG